jgi:hypothetical protein
LATASADKIDQKLMPQMRRDLAEQGQAFWQTARGILEPYSSTGSESLRKNANHVRAGITIFYFEDATDCDDLPPSSHTARKNFSRKKAHNSRANVSRRAKDRSTKGGKR